MELNKLSLSFPKQLEYKYLKSYIISSLLQIRVTIIFVLLIFLTLGTFNFIENTSNSKIIFNFRFFVIVPFLIALLVLTTQKVFLKWNQIILSGAMVLFSSSINYIYCIKENANPNFIPLSLIIILIFGLTIFKIRFIYGLITIIFSISSYFYILNYFDNINNINFASHLILVIVAIISAIINCYYQEYHSRRHFYLLELLKQEKNSEFENATRLQGRVEKGTAQLKALHTNFETKLNILKSTSFELHETTDKFREFYKDMPLSYVAINNDAKIIEVNPYFIKQVRYKSRNLIGKELSFFLDNNSIDLFLENFEKLKFEGKIHGLHLNFYTKDKQLLHFVLSATAERDENGNFKIARSILQNITESVQNQEATFNIQRFESIGLLAGGIAHDFNNLLGGIYGFNDLVQINLKNNNIERALNATNHIKSTFETATGLTNKLISFSSGGFSEKIPLSSKDLINDSIHFALSGSAVKCSSTLEKNLWNIEADEVQIKQMISNIILNAKHALKSKGKIIVSSENCEISSEDHIGLEFGNYIKIVIEDKGIGISKENIGKIFDPFFTTEKNERRGLGLSIARSVAKKHGGDIYVESKENQGSKFIIYLSSTFKKIENIESEIMEKENIKTNILILDDEDIIRIISERMLISEGHMATSVATSKEAIETFNRAFNSKVPFQVVILDLTIPGDIGGQEVLKELRKIDPKIKAIVSSGHATSPIIINFKDYGFNAALTKPFKEEGLSEKLSMALA